jgi:hypothetical protein
VPLRTIQITPGIVLDDFRENPQQSRRAFRKAWMSRDQPDDLSQRVLQPVWRVLNVSI